MNNSTEQLNGQATAMLTHHGPHTVELAPELYLYHLPFSQLQEQDDIRVSVLVPSRSRPALLRKSLHTIVNNAAHPEQVQIIIRCDIDDKHMAGFRFDGCRNVKIIRGQRMKGYASLHYFYTECAMHASGPLLLLWNDDAQMLTQGWDDKLWDETAHQRKKHLPGIWALSNNHWPYAFPVVNRTVVEKLGAFARFSYNDAYLHELAKACGMTQPVLDSIVVQHDMPPDSGWDDNTYSRYKSDFFQEIIEADAKLLMS